MKIGENGQIEETQEPSIGLSLTNEEIIFMYLTTRGQVLSYQDDLKKRQKSAKMIKTLLEASEDDDDNMTMIHSRGKNKQEMMEELNKALETLKEEPPQNRFNKAVYVKLFPYWIILKESADDLVKSVVDKCFDAENKIIQKMLAEERLED